MFNFFIDTITIIPIKGEDDLNRLSTDSDDAQRLSSPLPFFNVADSDDARAQRQPTELTPPPPIPNGNCYVETDSDERQSIHAGSAQ